MGNAQKMMGKKKGKDSKKDGVVTGSKSNRDDQENLVDSLISRGPIENFYDVNPSMVLGRGHYAVVHLGTCKQTGKHVAVKRIQVNKSRYEALEREVRVLKTVGSHPNIVTLYDLFVTNNELQLVLELLKGGELFDRMVEKGPYSEREASHHIRKIGLALKFLHRHGIVHRDLKPENLLLSDKSPEAELKIADFGLSKIVDDVASSTMQTVCGTWAYCAPEVKTSAVHTPVPGSSTNSQSVACYTAAVDLWSVGVILFVILGAYHPFDPDGDATDGQLWERICLGEFDFNDPAWDNISDLAKDLIKRLIVVDPAKRYTTDQLLAHPWVNLTASVPETPITPSIDKSLGGFVTKKRAMTPRVGYGAYKQEKIQNQNYYGQNQFQQAQPFGTTQQPPHPDFGLSSQSVSNHVQPMQVTSNHVTFQEPHYQHQAMQFQEIQKMKAPNPGLTLDTFTGKDNHDRMEIATPRQH